MIVEYDSNNSGGDWWLKDEDWYALEAAGWKVDWRKNMTERWSKPDSEGRWLGALATSASRDCLSVKVAIAEWETITGQDASALGCECCGRPHYFSEKY